MVTYYLDAYNVIHCSDPLRDIVQKSVDAARDTLIGMVAEYGALTGEKVVLVFDGAAGLSVSTDTSRGHGTLSLIHCEGAVSADAYIERAVFETDDRLNVVVVTADRTVAQSVRGMGALVLKPQSFMNQIRATLAEYREKRKTPTRKKFGVTLSERLSERVQAELETLRKAAVQQKKQPDSEMKKKNRRAGPTTTGS